MSSDKMMEMVWLFSLSVCEQSQPRREAPRGCFESRKVKSILSVLSASQPGVQSNLWVIWEYHKKRPDKVDR